MTSDDQHFLDHLNRASISLRSFVADLASYADSAESSATDALAEASRQLNHTFGFALPVPTRRIGRFGGAAGASSAVGKGSGGVLGTCQRWMGRHRALTAAVLAFVCTGAVGLVYLNMGRTGRRKVRKAKRASSGLRKEVVVVAGPADSELTRTVTRDLAKRGFIVYQMVTSHEEWSDVYSTMNGDVKPLLMDLDDLEHTDEVLEQFSRTLQTPVQVSPMSSRHYLEFTGLVIVPGQSYPTGSAVDILPSVWMDQLNGKVLSSINATRAFLSLIIQYRARVLLITPNIISSLKPALNSIECASIGALEGYMSSVEREMVDYGVHISRIKLGSIDYSLLDPNPDEKQSKWRVVKSSGTCELNHAVFDALTMSKPFVMRRVGRGSVTYDLIGNWMPNTLVQWMLSGRTITGRGSRRKVNESQQVYEASTG